MECVWGDYPGSRSGAGRYVDLYKGATPVGRLWANNTTVGLLHIPFADDDDYEGRRETEINHWNAAADIRHSKHLGLPAATAFDYVAAKYDHGDIEEGPLEHINYPELDKLFYVSRYDPYDSYNWCEEMQ